MLTATDGRWIDFNNRVSATRKTILTWHALQNSTFSLYTLHGSCWSKPVQVSGMIVQVNAA